MQFLPITAENIEIEGLRYTEFEIPVEPIEKSKDGTFVVNFDGKPRIIDSKYIRFKVLDCEDPQAVVGKFFKDNPHLKRKNAWDY